MLTDKHQTETRRPGQFFYLIFLFVYFSTIKCCRNVLMQCVWFFGIMYYFFFSRFENHPFEEWLFCTVSGQWFFLLNLRANLENLIFLGSFLDCEMWQFQLIRRYFLVKRRCMYKHNASTQQVFVNIVGYLIRKICTQSGLILSTYQNANQAPDNCG